MAFLPESGVVAMAHRGFSLDGLENSMAAFGAAIELGFRYVETDVHATEDGVLLAFHDHSLDRVTDRHGDVAALPWSQVRRARIGGREPIPQLRDLLDTWPDLHVNIDIKDEPAIDPLVRVIEQTRAHDRVCVTSFSDRRRTTALKRLSRPVTTSAGQTRTAAFVLSQGVPALARHAARGVDCLQVPERYGRIPVVTPRSLRAAHQVGLKVHVWTVNVERDMDRLLDMGVDGLITDRADILKSVLVDRDFW